MLTRARFRISLLQSLVESVEDICQLDVVMRDSLFRLLKWVAVQNAESLNGGWVVQDGMISQFTACEMYCMAKRVAGETLCGLPAQRG